MTHKFTLPSHKRLKSRKQINLLFEEGESQFVYPYKLLFHKNPDISEKDFPVQFTVSIPKKKIRSAVKRNLLKRRTREAYRLHSMELQEKMLKQSDFQLSLMLVYLQNEVLEYNLIEKSIVKHIKKLTDALDL